MTTVNANRNPYGIKFFAHIQLWVVMLGDEEPIKAFKTRKAAQNLANKLNNEITN